MDEGDVELTPTPHRRRGTWLRRVLRTVAAAVALTVLVLLLLATAFGLDHRVTSGSLVLEEMVPAQDLRSGDLVTFEVPGGDHVVTRRIVSITAGVAVTRGDRRPAVDPWSVELDRTPVSRVVVRVPLVGHLLTPGRAPIVVGAGVALAVLLVVDLVRSRSRRRPV